MDRRIAKRRPVCVLGHVVTRVRSVFCRVLDLSETGARLKSAQSDVIPDRFDLNVPSEGVQRTGEVQWRNGRELGVRFR